MTRACRWLVLGVLLFALLGPAPHAAARAIAEWTPTDTLPGTGVAGPAALLRDGRVLALIPAASATDPAAARRYDPATNGWASAATPPCPPCTLDSLTPLQFDEVLAIGRQNPPLRYIASLDRWEVAAPLAVSARAGHTATRLPDGRVLVVGGGAERADGGPIEPTTTVERYDPGADRWTTVAPLPDRLSGHRAVLLADGAVLVVGMGGRAYRYGPTADRWERLPGLPAFFRIEAAQLLPDGAVLVLGSDEAVLTLRAARLGAVGEGWQAAATPPLRPLPRFHVAPLGSGRMLALNIGGAGLYDPAADRWETAPPPTLTRAGALVQLRDGRALVVGSFSGARDSTGPSGAAVYEDTDAARRCFPETVGAYTGGRFLAYWEAHGGLAINGYPLGEPTLQVLDGRPVLVQYFERVRLEYHLENLPPYDILLGQFGRRIVNNLPAAPTAPVSPRPGETHYAETGHNVPADFQAYWAANGGLAQFGFPLTETFVQRLDDGNDYAVQYFERARLERHPENEPPYDILLGQFGRRILEERGRAAGGGP